MIIVYSQRQGVRGDRMRKTIRPKESREAKFADKMKLKKRLLIVMVSVLAVIFVLFIISFAIDKYYDKKDSVDNAPIDYDFYPADYEEYIYNDTEYNKLIENGFIYYKDSATGLTFGIDRESVSEHGEEAIFIVEYIYSIINGDVTEYNGFFSDTYYESNEKHGNFTMQKLYEVNIAKETAEPITENGNNYTKYMFVLEYKIFKNNGTFRNDIGDGSKKQYITVTDRDGELLIDSITTAKFK